MQLHMQLGILVLKDLKVLGLVINFNSINLHLNIMVFEKQHAVETITWEIAMLVSHHNT